jgi:branched-chain amino acid transport system permease protein
MTSFIGVLFDGIAYGSLLFVISLGLSVTLGLMGFINLAHGAFAMFGGYLAVWLMTRWGVPFLATLPLAFVVVGAAGAVLERLLYRRLYAASPLDQVLFTIGLTFMAMATATWLWGSGQQPVSLPDALRGQVTIGGVELGRYRLFLVAVVLALGVALKLLIERTRFGAQVRAAVDNRRAASALGIPVDRLFTLMFALGSGLAGVGGVLGIDVLGLDPSFPLKFMVYFLLVVVVGGAGTIHGAAVAAIVLGIFDVAGKYYFPQLGAFIIYFLMVALLLAFPAGLYGRRA